MHPGRTWSEQYPECGHPATPNETPTLITDPAEAVRADQATTVSQSEPKVWASFQRDKQSGQTANSQ